MESFSDAESARATSSDAGSPIYLDYNATTPVDPAVAAAMQPYIDTNFGNPSSGHVYGRTTHDAVDTARGQIAGLLGAGVGAPFIGPWAQSIAPLHQAVVAKLVATQYTVRLPSSWRVMSSMRISATSPEVV